MFAKETLKESVEAPFYMHTKNFLFTFLFWINCKRSYAGQHCSCLHSKFSVASWVYSLTRYISNTVYLSALVASAKVKLLGK